ncbi:CoA transferase [Streptomyces hoynatensis]|uniref:CoA transferase n=1 Tax=Streptomyces hoynatensis TaxID=1141874 RepID=A0A3A9ZAU4_9ACTN|nr:CoA transferase [Streptomyces hoynatensis]RKN44924.1 hypothetical protein D7294_07400 [Streptomyces hoynatensis]
MGILEGYRVVELSSAAPGTLASARLAGLGADVVRVEPPAGGERGTPGNAAGRGAPRPEPAGPEPAGPGPSRPEPGAAGAGTLRPAALPCGAQDPAALVALARGADVLLHDLAPRAAERLGLGHAALRAVNPALVYVAIDPGGHGPAPGGPPQAGPAAPQPADELTAAAAVEGTLAALLHRERTGEGRLVRVSAREATWPAPPPPTLPAAAPRAPRRRAAEPFGHTYVRAPYGVFPTKDGHLALAMPPLDLLGDALGLPELGGGEAALGGHSCRDEITALIRLRLPRRTTAEWLELFARSGISAGPVGSAEAS